MRTRSCGYREDVHIDDAFRLEDVEAARSIARAHPFATIVTADLRATHMPCLVDEDADGLVILGHVACADPVSGSLAGPVLLIFHGPHGYVSASWYGEDTIPTWNHVTLHVRGTPELLPDPLPLLRRTVEHFESAVEHPWSLNRRTSPRRSRPGCSPGSTARAPTPIRRSRRRCGGAATDCPKLHAPGLKADNCGEHQQHERRH